MSAMCHLLCRSVIAVVRTFNDLWISCVVVSSSSNPNSINSVSGSGTAMENLSDRKVRSSNSVRAGIDRPLTVFDHGLDVLEVVTHIGAPGTRQTGQGNNTCCKNPCVHSPQWNSLRCAATANFTPEAAYPATSMVLGKMKRAAMWRPFPIRTLEEVLFPPELRFRR